MCQVCELLEQPIGPEAVRDLADVLWQMAVDLRSLPLDKTVERIGAMDRASVACFHLMQIASVNGPRFSHAAEQARERIARQN